MLVNNGLSPEGIVIKMQTHEDRAEVWQEYYNKSIDSVTGNPGSGACTTNSSVGGSETTQIECDRFDADTLAVSKVQIEVELT